MEFCKEFKSCHISFNPENEKIEIARCCMKPTDLLASLSIEEWRSIPNKVEYLNSLVNVWPENRDIIPGWCTKRYNPNLTECFYDKDLEKFENFEVAVDMTCNARCRFCAYERWIDTVKEKHLTLEVRDLYFEILNELIDNIDYNCSIRLTDHGEPLIWKEQTIQVLEKILQKENLNVMITTNGLSLLDESIFGILKLLQENKKLKGVGCSINAFTEETHFNKMRIKHLYDIIKRNELLGGVFSYVVSDENDIKEFEQITEFRKNANGHLIVMADSNDFYKTSKIVKELNEKYKDLI